MATKRLKIQFTEFIPETIESGVLYISMEYATASHKCACGCGQEVVTPFTPTDWKLMYDGESVTLSPSIGNWSYPCRAHYFVRNNRIIWAGDMSQKDIDAGRRRDKAVKTKQYMNKRLEPAKSSPSPQDNKTRGMFHAILRFFGM